MLHKLSCVCGKHLEFMEYYSRSGILPMVKVGCHNCKIMFFIPAEDLNVGEIPRMNQFDWLMMWKHGRYNTKGNIRVNAEDGESCLIFVNRQ